MIIVLKWVFLQRFSAARKAVTAHLTDNITDPELSTFKLCCWNWQGKHNRYLGYDLSKISSVFYIKNTNKQKKNKKQTNEQTKQKHE